MRYRLGELLSRDRIRTCQTLKDENATTTTFETE